MFSHCHPGKAHVGLRLVTLPFWPYAPTSRASCHSRTSLHRSLISRAKLRLGRGQPAAGTGTLAVMNRMPGNRCSLWRLRRPWQPRWVPKEPFLPNRDNSPGTCGFRFLMTWHQQPGAGLSPHSPHQPLFPRSRFNFLLF